MSFRDDEPPPANSSAGREPIHRGSDRVRLKAYSNDKAPLEENEQQVLLELVDTSSASERSGLDLVAVLDVSGSMGEYGKLDKLKTAMKFVISKLGPMDRLSIVSFSSVAKKLCRLHLMTVDAKEELKGIVEKLSAGGTTNMRHGLEIGLDVLDQRLYRSGRVSSVVLMSDGEEDSPGASLAVDASGTAVYTFGFGENHDAEVLGAIASKSRGGTFHYIRDEESLTIRFAEILAGLLSVVVRDLELVVSELPGHSKIIIQEKDEGDTAEHGRYRQRRQNGKVYITFGDLFGGEARKVIIRILLPAVHRGYRATVLTAQCLYRIQGKDFYSPGDPLRCFIHRTRSASPDAKNPKVEEEEDRLFYVDNIEEASKTNDYDSAHGKLEETHKVLDAKRPNRMIIIVKNELQQLLQLKTWKDLLASLLAYKVSHDRQRGGPFATSRMRRYTEQADKFEKDPNEEPPSVDDEVKEEAEIAMKRPATGQHRDPRILWRRLEHSTSGWLAWAMVILCTVLAIGVIVAGVAVFAVYIFFKPKMPCLVVSDAHLVLLQYDQGGTVQNLQMSITVRAENNNSKADAAFSSIDLALGFHGADIVLLRAEPFVVARNSSLPLQYNVLAVGPTLDLDGMRAMDESLKAGMVPFDLFGKARTRWKVGVFVKLRYWTRISCRLRFFFPGNGTVVPTDRDRCRSR
ncbi:hypothetical protein SETIT_8G052500v2 [Setaria italica]|uniref:VWFA domain-containing protein n=2 Tax=Setaria italica TaxID=4555 RepID=A0A368S634_SETIT|nr:uncharacterized protein LOC101773048 [Setaria italica]RCV37310.1 hypothetical protein SETIT_8G052500v2 [Setaria italica]